MDHGLPQSQPSLSTRGGQLVKIVAWFLLVVSTLAITARLFAKRTVSRKLGADDALAGIALMFSIGSTAATSSQVTNGLGQELGGLENDQIARLLKHRLMSFIVGALISIWWLISELAAAFQCKPPETWNTVANSCIDRVALWYFIGIFSIISDLLLVLLPFYIVQALHMKTKKKVIIIALFGTRLIDIGAAAAQIAFAPTLNSPNVSKDLWPWILILQVVECVTIVTSCLQYLRQLLETIPSGMYMSDELRRRGHGRNGSQAYGSNDATDGSNPATKRNRQSRAPTSKNQTVTLDKIANIMGQTSATITGPLEPDNAQMVNQAWDSSSYNSQSHILKTTTFGAFTYES